MVSWISKPAPVDWFKDMTISPVLTPAALDGYYEHVRDQLASDMVFLRTPIAGRRRLSYLLKWVALLGLAGGILLPALAPGDVAVPGLGVHRGVELAFIAVAAGGIGLAVDRVFNISSSWARLTLAEAAVQKVRERLQFDWAKRRPAITDANAAAEGPALIDLLRDASQESTAIVETQKRTWTTELDAAAASLLAQLDTQRASLAELVRAQQEQASKPTTGAVNIAIDNPANLKGPVVIRINGEEKHRAPAPAANLTVDGIPAGLQAIALEAERSAVPPTPFVFEQTVAIAAGAAATLQVKT